jgi:hypothetical protein
LFIFTGTFYLETVTLSIPKFGGMTFSVNKEDKKVAWNLFVETMTRITTQPLPPNSGYLRESLNSLYSLFSTTRTLLKNIQPTKNNQNKTVELFAMQMLNNVLRPFLAYWHPMLSDFEKVNKDKPESEWEYNHQFRRELEKIRLDIIAYSKAFGEIANVPQLDKYYEENS